MQHEIFCIVLSTPSPAVALLYLDAVGIVRHGQFFRLRRIEESGIVVTFSIVGASHTVPEEAGEILPRSQVDEGGEQPGKEVTEPAVARLL